MLSTRGHLSSREARILCELTKDINTHFLEDIINELNIDENEFRENISIIIKKDYNIFNFEDNIILELYDAIINRYNINLIKKNEKTEFDVSPIIVFYKDETESWYLEYYKKRNYHVIKLDSTTKIAKCNGLYKGYRNIESGWRLNSSSIEAKLRIYNEKGILSNFIRDLVGKKAKEMIHTKEYTDITVSVEDENILKAWVRKHIPGVLVIEPEYLRNELIQEAKDLISKYK